MGCKNAHGVFNSGNGAEPCVTMFCLIMVCPVVDDEAEPSYTNGWF
jgi:hypothetical protein